MGEEMGVRNANKMLEGLSLVMDRKFLPDAFNGFAATGLINHS
jgi:hypothetical protein